MPTLAERMKKIGEQETKIETNQNNIIRQVTIKYGLSENEEQLIKSVKDINKLDMAIEKIVTSDLKQDVMDAFA